MSAISRPGRPVAVLAAVAALSLLAGCGSMTAGELSPSVDRIVSAAAEGRLLAHDVARDRSKATFVRVRARELGEELDHELEKLNDATAAPGVGREKDTASGLADRTATAIGQLQRAPDDRRGARRTEVELGRLARSAERLAGKL